MERISAGVLKLQKRPIDISTLVADAIDRARLLAMKKSIEIEQDLEPGVIAADAELLQFAIYNLLANAVKYSPDGSEIRVALRSEGQAARLAVTDQGCGIEPAEQQRIFERFYRTKRHRDDAAGERTPNEAALFSLRVASSMVRSLPTIWARTLRSTFGISKRSSTLFSFQTRRLPASHGVPSEAWNRKPSDRPARYSFSAMPRRERVPIYALGKTDWGNVTFRFS